MFAGKAICIWGILDENPTGQCYHSTANVFLFLGSILDDCSRSIL